MNALQNQTDGTPYLSIVIPAFNEESRITETIPIIFDYLKAQSYQSEVIVVDDGSTDSTADICRKYEADHACLRLIHYPVNRGKGYAVRTGVMASTGEYVLMCDADLATPIDELDGFWKWVQEGIDVVIASRAIPGSHLVEHQPFYREFGGRVCNLIIQLVAVPGIHDTQCGFKLFSRRAAQGIFALCFIDGFSFDIEALFIARRSGFSIVEAPVHWYHKSGSKVRVLRDGLATLLDLFRIRFYHRRLICNKGKRPAL